MSNPNLFDSFTNIELLPLATQLRPKTIEEFVGHKKWLKVGTPLEVAIRTKRIENLIFWGPPGSGKTTLALILAQTLGYEVLQLNAVDVTMKQIREAIDNGRQSRLQFSRKTLLFFDEIHRLNKTQQDLLLPGMESGDVVLIGATTENPSYELSRALLSRSRVVTLEGLKETDLDEILNRTLSYLKLQDSFFPQNIKDYLIQFSSGDARKLINSIEQCAQFLTSHPTALTLETLSQVLGCRSAAYDKNSEMHYDLLSAFIKSIRGSDADAALYYLVRMLNGGEDPILICRRLIVLSSEDIGNADPRALTLAVSTLQGVEAVGMPEARLILAQAVTYLSSAPKSNRSYLALNEAMAFLDQTKDLPVPLSLRSSRTDLAKSLNYGFDYQLPHDFEKGWIKQNYWPEGVQSPKFYHPANWGFEKVILELNKWRESQK